MDPQTHLYAACLALLATHFVPSTPLRATLVRTLGQWPYTGVYSLVAFAVIGWMSWAYARAPVEPMWEGIRWLPAVVMPLSFVLLAGGLFASNPTVVGMYRQLSNADPARGMIRVTRHPVMWSFLLWALTHVIARGDLKSLVFFGSFAVLAGLGTLLIDMRKAKALGRKLGTLRRGHVECSLRRHPAGPQSLRREGDRLAQPADRPGPLRALLLVPPADLRRQALLVVRTLEADNCGFRRVRFPTT